MIKYHPHPTDPNLVVLRATTRYIGKHSDEDLKAAVLAEREACAKLLNDFAKTTMVPVVDSFKAGLKAGAYAILSRGEK